jgi:uncharacterized membrane protein
MKTQHLLRLIAYMAVFAMSSLTHYFHKLCSQAEEVEGCSLYIAQADLFGVFIELQKP